MLEGLVSHYAADGSWHDTISSHPASDEHANPRAWLLAVLLTGLSIRLTVAPFSSFHWDALAMEDWATRLVTEPLTRFYMAPRVDHLPGDLWILWALAHAYHLFSPTMHVHSPHFVFLLKLVAALADVGIGTMLYLIGRRFGGPSVGLLAALFYVFNPAIIFLTSIWGQWDAISAFFTLTALWLLLGRVPQWSFPVLTYAALIKPQLAVLAPLFVLVCLRRYARPHLCLARRTGRDATVESIGRSLRRALVAVTASLVVLVVVPLPFDIGPPLVRFATHWDFGDRISYALNLYPYTTLNAFTLWDTPIVGGVGLDRRPFLLGLTYQHWGILLLVCTCLLILVRYWRSGDDRDVLWAYLAITFSSFMLATRVHERYLLPTIVVAALAAAVAPRMRWLVVALSLTYLANLFMVYDRIESGLQLHRLDASPKVSGLLSLLNVGLFVYALFWGRATLRRAAPRTILFRPATNRPGAQAVSDVGASRYVK